MGDVVRAINADEKAGYLKLHSPARRAELERLIAKSPGQPLKQVLFGDEGVTVKSIALRSRSFDYGAVVEVTSDSDKERPIEWREYGLSRLRQTPDGWVFGPNYTGPDAE